MANFFILPKAKRSINLDLVEEVYIEDGEVYIEMMSGSTKHIMDDVDGVALMKYIKYGDKTPIDNPIKPPINED